VGAVSSTDQDDRGPALPPAGAATGQLTTAVLVELRAELERADATGDPANRSHVHELVAACLAAQGEWKAAYSEMRTSVELALDRRGAGGREQRLLAEVALLRQETADARRVSMRDSLTETFNRRFLDQALRSLTEQRGDGVAPHTAVALVDLDLFKQVNDKFGHAMGDRVLQRVVELLQLDLPPKGFCARYGGEEFVLVLPGCDLSTAVMLCERARSRIEQHQWDQLVAHLRVTVSIGVACPAPDDQGEEGAHNQLVRADVLLYAAKASGRNAVAFRASPGSPLRLAGAAGPRRLVRDLEGGCAVDG